MKKQNQLLWKENGSSVTKAVSNRKEVDKINSLTEKGLSVTEAVYEIILPKPPEGFILLKEGEELKIGDGYDSVGIFARKCN
jgi:hypothetical protein